MTVEKIIESLKKFDKDLPVRLTAGEDGCCRAPLVREEVVHQDSDGDYIALWAQHNDRNEKKIVIL